MMSDEFGLPSGTVDVWTAPPPGRDPSEGRFDLIARLHSGATPAQLTQEAGRISRELRGDDWGAVTSRLDDVLTGDRRPALLVAQAAAGLVLVVACLSVITMLIGRSVARRREFALRQALGAGTMQVLRMAVVAGQIALAIVLLAGAGLLTRSVGALLAEDGGYDAGRVVTARLMLDDTRFPDDRALVDFVNRLLGEVRALPTVTAAGVGSMLPPADAPISINLWMNRDTGDDRRVLSWGAVTSGFFEALGTSLEDGRRFRVEDERAVIPNAILSVSAARFIFRDDSVIGKSMGWAVERMALTRDTTVLGVVGDMKYRGLAADRDASIYVPWPQRPMGLSHLVVRSSGDPSALVPTLRRHIARLDPTLPLPEVRTLEDHVADSIAGRRLQLVPAVAVAALALVVSMFGLFGALGRAVAERRHELSIRAALGASPARLVRLVAVGSLAMTTVGLLAGLASAAVMGRGLASLLYGVSPYDPLTFSESLSWCWEARSLPRWCRRDGLRVWIRSSPSRASPDGSTPVAVSGLRRLPGVTVTVSSPSLQGTRAAITDINGNYSLPQLPPGDYSVVFEISGFGDVRRGRDRPARRRGGRQRGHGARRASPRRCRWWAWFRRRSRRRRPLRTWRAMK